MAPSPTTRQPQATEAAQRKRPLHPFIPSDEDCKKIIDRLRETHPDMVQEMEDRLTEMQRKAGLR